MTRLRKFGHAFSSTHDEPGDDYEFVLAVETDLAWGVVSDELDTIFLPKSATSVGEPRPRNPGDTIKLWVPDWLAEEKGIA